MRTAQAAFAILIQLLCLQAIAGDRPPPQIRFCPADAARTYPLDSRGRVQGLLVPHIAVVNKSPAAFEPTAIDIELLADGRVVDARQFGREDIGRFALHGPDVQEIAQAMSFMFCGGDLIGPEVRLGGPILQVNEGVVVMHQVFAFNDERDALRVRVAGLTAGAKTEVSAVLPILSEPSKSSWIFPLRGASYVGWGPSFHTGHRWIWPEAYALDIARVGESGLSYRNDGLRFGDYYAYGAEVHAAAPGKVVESVSDAPEDESMLQRPGEATDAYTARVRETQGKLLKTENAIMGNYVVIDHGERTYSLYAHLQPGSVRVRNGDRVAAGALLGKLGSSGNSTEPHLHFHVCSGSNALQCSGVPVIFSDIRILWADTERALQSGDIIRTK
jgi:hypothetical protein